jgi:ATP-dependent Clp protease ATP-binding subunit ClpC
MADETYEQALDRDGRDLVQAARSGAIRGADLREDEVRSVVEQLEARRSVLLVGPPGVGKTAIVHGLAERLAKSEGERPRIVELSTVSAMSGTRYLGEWETKVTQMVRAAEKTRAILYFSDIWNLDQAGVTRFSARSLFDALRPYVESQKLVLLGESTPELLRKMDRIPGFASLFHKQQISPLPAESVDLILDRYAERKGLPLDEKTRAAVVQLTSRFLPARPQPGPAMRLLDQVASYADEKSGVGEEVRIDPAFIEKVFSIYSGLPLFVVSKHSTARAQEIRSWFQERIVGQEAAIEAVVETISLFKAGLNDPTKPLGTLLFVGPTGVGKTEVARALATYLFGSATRLLRFDLSEYKDYHSFETLLGSPSDPDRPAALLDPVRTQPFQVLLFDELEKAHPNVWDLMLSLLDEGRLTAPGGDTVDFRRTIVVATSNAGAEDAAKTLGFDRGEEARVDRVENALRQYFRPEFLNRFQHIVVFHPLTKDQVRKVARQELRRILEREGVTSRNLVVEVDDEALDVVIDRGYEPRFGARALKREIQRQIVLPLAVTLMEKEVEAGQVLKLTGKDGRVRVRLLDTAESREAKREREPVRAKDGRKLTRPELLAEIDALLKSIDALGAAVEEKQLVEDQKRLIEVRSDHNFWKDPTSASRVLRELDRITMMLDRLDHLQVAAEELDESTTKGTGRDSLEQSVRQLLDLEAAVDAAWLELVAMGKDGAEDVIVEIEPIGGPKSKMARDLLVEVYTNWAKSQKMELVWLCEPKEEEEPAIFGVKGRYPYGFLRAESGLHRVKSGDDHAVARVRVIPWTDEAGEIELGRHRALKTTGAYGGKIRSRLECGEGLVLQNDRTLAQNRELALEIAGSWKKGSPRLDTVVRRYDLTTPMFADVATGASSGRPDALSPQRFHELLRERVLMARQAERAAR